MLMVYVDYQMVEKSFKIDLAFQTQNWRVTDIQPAIF